MRRRESWRHSDPANGIQSGPAERLQPLGRGVKKRASNVDVGGLPLGGPLRNLLIQRDLRQIPLGLQESDAIRPLVHRSSDSVMGEGCIQNDTSSSLKSSFRYDMQTLGDRLKQAMRAAGISSQAELSRQANLRPNTITRWIHGTTESPRPNDIGVVCRLLSVRPEWLLLGEDPMQADVVMETPASYRAEPLDAELLTAILAAIQEGLEARKVKLPPKVFGTLVATIYEAALQETALREDLSSRIQPFIRLALAGAG